MSNIPLSYQIQKRNSTLVDFDVKKIENAILKAAGTVGELDATLPGYLAEKVARLIDEHFIQPEKALSVEQIQDLVEIVLMRSGQLKIAKEFILYREEHKKLRAKRQEEVIKKAKTQTIQRD